MIVNIGVKATSKLEVLKKISQIAKENYKVKCSETYLNGLIKREEDFSTGFGKGIAIPHCKSDCVIELSIIICKLENSIKWDCIDKDPVNFIIALAIPKTNSDDKYLQTISTLARNLMNDEFTKELKSLNNEDDIINKIKSIIN